MNKNLKFISTLNMPHEEWLEHRKHSIGGSDAAAVVGMNAFVSRYSLWAEKTGRIPGFQGNLATEVGTFMEEFIAQKFASEAGKKVRRFNKIIYNPDYPFAHVNIDRDVVGEDAGLECKYTDSMNLKKFKGGEYPENYYVQCVHSMAVTGAKRWYLAVLIGNKEFKWFTIERDEEEIAALMNAEREFWELVQNNTPPVADGAESTGKAINALYPTSNGDSIDISGRDIEITRYMQLSAQIKELEKQKAEAANRVKEFLGDAGRGESEIYKVSWTSSERKSFDDKAFAKDNPNLDISQYYKTSVSRTLRVTEKKV